MWSNIGPFIAATFYLLSPAQGAAVLKNNCKATSNWPGWNGIKYAFVFGDSYTSTTFNVTGTQPTPTNPLGNPNYPGFTSANGPNWVDYLTVKYNASKLLTYNLAYGGATVNSALVAPFMPQVSSISNQVENEWFPTYAGSPPSTPWSPSNTLFALFDGINDVGNSWFNGLPATTVLNAKIFAVYHGLVMSLYYAGARNFAFLKVPPVDRSPLVLQNTPAQQAQVKADILAWNDALVEMVKYLKDEKPDVNVWVVDANKLFTQVLDKPTVYAATKNYKNVTAYCEAYQNGTPTGDYFDPSCGVPADEYFWLNSLHPTFPMHDVIAQGVAQQLANGPNVC